MYKKALNAFFLKVHPDFFHHDVQQQTVNQNAVAQLNELLAWAREFKQGTLRPPPATTIAFTFYRRVDDADGKRDSSFAGAIRSGTDEEGVASTGAEGRPQESSFAKRGFLSPEGGQTALISSTFELPQGFVASEPNRGLVERSVNKFLRDLLRRAECIDSVTESLSVAEDDAAARREAKPLRRRPDPRLKNKKGSPSASKTLLDEASEAINTQWTLTSVPTIEELMDADHILLSKTLSPLQCSAALLTLRSYLGELHYEQWESMPLIIDDHWDIGVDITGGLTVPWDFTPIQFVSFLHQNADAVAKCRTAATAFATEVEQLITELCTALELDDVLVSCSHKEAVATLRLLHRNKELLHGYGLTNLTLELGMRHATRANGVVVINVAMQTTQELREWLQALSGKLDLQRKLYRVSKQMLETTMWHLKEFRDMVEPGGVDAFVNNDCTYAERLTWAKELFRVGPALAHWDWQEFTFLLGPELEVDWSRKQLLLPPNFDGDALVRYVEEVQQGAKEKEKEALLKASAMRRLTEEELRERAHAEDLQLSDDAGDASDAQFRQQMREDDPLVPGVQPMSEAMRNLYKQSSPHMEEYMSSSDNKVDPLSVERPLSHAVTFNSDTEAEEQLKWEGFYQDPYVDQMPTGDLDDLDHTYRLTNRWHREAAAKKLLEELQSTYGKKSRRFDYQKMGDVLEINNARVQPKGFPVLTRGMKPSDG
ncbi:putative mitochondrial hypothetical protein [Leptomonas pyrrhocoris]|uniref:DUF4460 domain-containing protein n=1 Tax=Leptomonas pyrrhocoris TaxID=157538 RepID=A0A0M9FQT8_LEPPY|nr:putative mitochondrial hypothetical protein [Leptomonas pyrrhocoris]XP_015652635.1 putative mitochondrial hypothetical protein [Leptomonas pyrrhocoris]KPA74195.1 putative mitochondrial hypothetical protein [Leptomonas pyrrhocoris]KPA74196.1 putative mitochondrial hypothetical protein [Leptomonas pyrrhocoris]|eukprot:XP_015652634.1 putative mitochondrial hypothetical protein [Leptomonas pyrrhocoris]